MNPDLPPIRLPDPQIKTRRREKPVPVPSQVYTSQQRSIVAKRAIKEIKAVELAVKKLTPEQKRAVFLKITHDRRLTREDLAGTKFKLFGEPGEKESLVVPKNGAFEAIEKRMLGIFEGDGETSPKGYALAENLRTIALADPKERLSDEMLENYNEFCKRPHLVYEIEISSQSDQSRSKQKEIIATIESLKKALGLAEGTIFDVDYQKEGARILLWSTGNKLKELVEDCQWHLKISFFDTRPNIKTFHETFQNFNVGKVSIIGPSEEDPTICVIDSGVAVGNPFLEPVVRKEISRSWVYGCSPLEDGYGHGSGVASLAAYHSLAIEDGGENRATAWIASARIMNDEGELDIPRLESDEEDRAIQVKLLSTILREIVEHFSSKGIRLFVLSFEIQGHIWSEANRRQIARSSWLARTVDSLSREYEVVFCCITGNLGAHDIEDLSLVQPYPHYLLSTLGKVLDPGPAALAITCGSIAHSTRVIGGNHTPIAAVGMPSPFSRTGPGFGDSIKPDLVEYGGNLVIDQFSQAVVKNGGTEVVMASNALTPALQRMHGTSFAAPRVANHLAALLRGVQSMSLPATNTLLRSFLAASAHPQPEIDGLNKNGHLLMTGHGLPDGEKALQCEGHSVLLFWYGSMKANQTALFRIHVPAELASIGRTKKVMTVAAAASPPVQRWGIADYLGTQLKFWLFRGDSDFGVIEAQMQRETDEKNEASKLTTSHMDNCRLKISRRTAGTLQCDTFVWQDHKSEFSEDDYTLAVSLGKKSNWMNEDDDVPISVVVRIDETSGTFSQLYARVLARVEARIKAKS